MGNLAIYLHFPFCKHRCNYCSFLSTAGCDENIPEYVCALIREIGLRQRIESTALSVYFGGGTPSLLNIAQVSDVINSIRKHYVVSDNTEITLEANPGTVDIFYLRSLHEIGVNRLSLGAQSLDDGELNILGRRHNVAEIKMAISCARTAGFGNLSLDFIYGIPGRNIKRWRTMLRDITSLRAEHLSLYALSIDDGTPLAEAVNRGVIAPPDPDAAACEYELACDTLARAGYEQYEISNWSQPGYESRHNLTYWTGGDYLGLGCGAHSFLDGVRCAGTNNLDEYLAALGAGRVPPQTADATDPKNALGEAVMLGLRLNAGVSADDIWARFKIDLQEYFRVEITELIALGLITASEGCLRLTPRGRLLGNEVFLRFMPN